MATRYFGANSLAAFSRNSINLADVTQAGSFDSAYVASSLKTLINGTGTEYAESWAFSVTGTFYWAFEQYTDGSGGGIWPTGPGFYNAGTPVFQIVCTLGSPQTFRCQYWNGSAWTNTGATYTLSGATRYRMMVKITLNSGFELYVNNVLTASGSGWTGGGTTVTNIRLYSYSSNAYGTYYSQMMVADYDIRDSHLRDPGLNGNSASNTGAASGVYTDVNEVTLDDSTAINIATVANKAGQTKTAITVPSGIQIGAMIVNARGRVSGGTVTDGKLGIRSGGTNFSSSGRGYSTAYGPKGYISATDPATGVAFTQTGFNAAEVFLEAS